MTYTLPEGAEIGTFTANTLPASFCAPADAVVTYKIYGTSAGAGVETESGEPAGFKIPILNTSGVTENLVGFSDGSISFESATTNLSVLMENGILTFNGYTTGEIYSNSPKWKSLNFYLDAGTYYITSPSSLGAGFGRIVKAMSDGSILCGTIEFTFTLQEKTEIFIAFYINNKTFDNDEVKLMIVKGSTPPDHYIPHRYESNYDLFIGDTKLGENEYLDFESQKVYKYVDGVLTPQDPPAPFPTIATYKGENTLSSTETLGNIELTGDWLAIMGSTEDESIDIGFTVDAEEYIAFVTVDDGPSTQVSDTITMPSSADSFSLEVVAWGREQYTDTVYNALS